MIPAFLGFFGCYEWVRKWNRNKNCKNYFESNGFYLLHPVEIQAGMVRRRYKTAVGKHDSDGTTEL